MATPEKAEAINGAKYRSYQKPNGSWSDPLIQHDFWSRTFMPIGTKYIEGQEVSEMITKIKATADVKFEAVDLSDATKVELDKAKILYDGTMLEPIIKK